MHFEEEIENESLHSLYSFVVGKNVYFKLYITLQVLSIDRS